MRHRRKTRAILTGAVLAACCHPADDFDPMRWQTAEGFPKGPQRAAWAYFLKPTQQMTQHASDVEQWLYASHLRNLPIVTESFSGEVTAASVPLIAARIRVESLSLFYAELAALEPASQHLEVELKAAIAHVLSDVAHPYGRLGIFYQDPAATTVVDLPGDDLPYAYDTLLMHQLERLHGWRLVRDGWSDYLTSLAEPNNGDSSKWSMQVERGLNRVAAANQKIAHLNITMGQAIANDQPCTDLDRATVADWADRGVVPMSWAEACLPPERLAAIDKLNELLQSFRGKEQQTAYVEHCSNVLGNGDVSTHDFPLIWDIQLAQHALRVHDGNDAPEDRESLGAWAMAAVTVPKLPNQVHEWAAAISAELADALRSFEAAERELLQSRADAVTQLWQAFDALRSPVTALSAELVATRDRLASFKEQLQREFGDPGITASYWLDAMYIDRLRQTSGLSLTGTRYTSASPMPFHAALASGNVQVTDIASFSPVISAATRHAQRLESELLNSFAAYWPMMFIEDASPEEARHHQQLFQQWQGTGPAIARHLWSVVETLERSMPVEGRSDFRNALTQQLVSDVPENPVLTCVNAARTIATDDVCERLDAIAHELAEADWALVHLNAEAVYLPDEMDRLERAYLSHLRNRRRLFETAIDVMRAASEDIAPLDQPIVWRLLLGIDDPFGDIECALANIELP